MHRLMCIISAILIYLLTVTLSGQTISADSLTIDAAVIKAIENNPGLKILREEINALESIKIQSGLIPNPEFGIEVENIFGDDEFSGFEGSEITAIISQDILLAGKISKRERVAEISVSLAEWDYEEKRLELITSVRKIFLQALLTQKLIEKNNELINISEEFIANLNERVQAGKISPAEVSRAKIILNSLKMDLTRLEAEYFTSISKLESLIYDPGMSIKSLKGTIEYTLETPSYDSLLFQLADHPALKRFESEYGILQAIIDFENSKSIPDLTISAGYRRHNGINANTFVLGASIP
ncbi:MAG: TolC family protein, partial [Ignavibacteria bacterium]|nr:TolC family protein [Ignavibacteria bacterium]